MYVQNLYEPFEIEISKVQECPCRPHKHTFFELVYIMEGKGSYYINENRYQYRRENLFLVMPHDNHHTEVGELTTFIFIRFNNIFLEAQKAQNSYSNLGDWIKKLEYILQNSNRLLGCIIRNDYDKPLLKALMLAILQEHSNKQFLQNEVVQNLINTIITLVARNISLHIPENLHDGSNPSFDMVQYIHQNIYDPEKLKAEAIATHFNISLNYISEYFKKHTGENLHSYIMNYKLRLVETRLQHSNMRLNEIAYELGFTDESHLTKSFKKYKGMSPSSYRKSVLLMSVE